MIMKVFCTGRRLRRAESGMALVEISFVMPILLTLLVVVAEFGLYFYTYTTLDKATRIAARYLTSQTYDPDNPTLTTNSIFQAKLLAVCGRTDTCPASEQILSDFTTTNLTITGKDKDGNTTTTQFPVTITVGI